MLYNRIIQILTLFACHVYVANGLNCAGCLELDELTFDKIIAKFHTVLIKFDIVFPYGKKHDEYAKFAQDIGTTSVSEMIVGLVGIKNYGKPTNNLLSERFGVEDQLPAIKLFTNHNALKWIDFPKDENVTIENLRQFVRRHSDIKIALSDCLPQFDAYAAEFVKALQLTSIESKQLQAIVRDAHNQSTKLETEQEKQIAQIYLLIMRRVLERDIGFIGAERMRLQQLLDGKISEQKRKEINQKLNILSAFHGIEMIETHTEL